MISAFQARILYKKNKKGRISVETNKNLFDYLGEKIEDAAKDGCHTIIFHSSHFDNFQYFPKIDSEYVLDVIKPKLVNKGFVISYYNENLKISWE